MNRLKGFVVKRLIVTTMSLIILLLFILIPTHTNNIIEEKNKNTKIVYLLDNDNYLTKVYTYYDNDNIENEIIKIIELLKNGNDKFNGVIPSNVFLQSVVVKKNNVYLDFNSELLNTNNISKIYEGLVYSITEINGLDNIYISVNSKLLDDMPLNRNYGINKEYDLNDLKYINKTTIFFSKNNHLVPITKISNDKDDKIKIIIKELKSSVNALNNLNGYVDNKLNLLDYKINKSNIELVFSDDITDHNTIELITSSIFENYDVNSIILFNKDKTISTLIEK